MSNYLFVYDKSNYLCSTINYNYYIDCMLKYIDQQTLYLALSEMSGFSVDSKEKELEEIFLDNVSHEIRTPLNAIIGFNDLLNGVSGQHMDEEERMVLKDHIHKNADRLLTVMDDILDLSRMEKGSLRLHKTVVSLMEICFKAREHARREVKKDVKLKHEYPMALKDTYLYTDGKRLEQVLRIFLSNACQHTYAGCITIKVKVYDSLEDRRRMLQLRVDDTGIGVPKEQQPLLFMPFRKADKNTEGLGVGLAICKHIAKLLNGRVYFNDEYTEGASFVFEMPFEEI